MTPCVNDSKAICCGVAQEGLGQCVYCFVCLLVRRSLCVCLGIMIVGVNNYQLCTKVANR